MVQQNHKDYVVKEITDHPGAKIIELMRSRPLTLDHADDCIAAIVVTSDFLDRTHAADAVKAILKADLIADSDKVKIYPAIPKKPATGDKAMTIMPFTQIITNCTAAFKLAIAANPVFHGIHEGLIRPIIMNFTPTHHPVL